MPTSDARTRWAAIVTDLESSGQSARGFAKERGLNVNTLTWWRWRLRSEADQRRPSPFAELTLVEDAPSPSPESASRCGRGLVLTLDAYGARVHVDATTDLPLLRHVLEALC